MSHSLHRLIYSLPTNSPSGKEIKSLTVKNGGFLVGPRYGVHGVTESPLHGTLIHENISKWIAMLNT